MLTAAVIGCGRIGSLWDAGRAGLDPITHAGAHAAHPGVRLVAGVDPSPERRVAFEDLWGVPAYFSVKTMLEHARPAIWSVCTPPEQHLPVAVAGIAAGARALWCEKPLAGNLADARTLVEVAASAHVPLAVNHGRRWDPAHRAASAWLRDGGIGPLRHVSIRYVRGIANYGSHAFDLIRMLTGDEIEWVQATDDLREAHSDPSLTVYALLRGGAAITFCPSPRSGDDLFEVDLLGDAGRAIFTDMGRIMRVFRRDASVAVGGSVMVPDAEGRFGEGLRGMAVAALSNLIAAVEDRAPLLSTGADGLAAMAAIEGARRSAALGGRRMNLADLTAPAAAAR
jgi:predicted dehydrogenase